MTDLSTVSAKKSHWKRNLVIGVFVVAIAAALIEQKEPPQAAAPAAPAGPSVDDLVSTMKPIGDSRMDFAFAIPAGAQPSEVEAAAKARCKGLAICGVYGWRDQAQMPSAWPMLSREADALAFRYALNRNTDYERTDWSKPAG